MHDQLIKQRIEEEVDKRYPNKDYHPMVRTFKAGANLLAPDLVTALTLLEKTLPHLGYVDETDLMDEIETLLSKYKPGA